MSSSSDKKKRWRHFELVCGIVILFIMLAFLVSPVAFGYYYKTRFFPNTTVAGVNVSGLPLGESKILLDQKYGNPAGKQLSIDLVDKTFSFPLNEAGISLDWRTPLNQTFQDQRSQDIWHDGFELIKYIVLEKNTNQPVALKLNNTQFNTKLDAMLKEVNREPVNAQIRVDKNLLVIDKEIYGVGVNKSVLEDMIKKNLQTKSSKPSWQVLKLTFRATKLKPAVTESTLASVKLQTETLIKNPVILTFENKKYTFSSSNMIKWVKFETKDNQSTPTFNRSAIDRDVAAIAKKIDIKPIDKLLSSIDSSVMQEGKDGRSVARSKAVDEIIAALNNNPQPIQATTSNPATGLVATASAAAPLSYTIAMQVDPKPFATKTQPPPFTPGMYPGKYIEVNLTEQKMYLWEGLNKVSEYRVSTGKRSTPTREGIFKIKNKARVGKSFPWIMPWWMAFAQDKTGAWQGIHELPVDMRTGRKEGIGDIGYAVSHGCIRLAIGDAQKVYDWAEVGIPMYVHK